MTTQKMGRRDQKLFRKYPFSRTFLFFWAIRVTGKTTFISTVFHSALGIYKLKSKSMFSTRGLGEQREILSLRGFLCLETFLVMTTRVGGAIGIQWVERPGILLDILHCTGQHLQQTVVQSSMSIVPRFGSPGLNTPAVIFHKALVYYHVPD